MKSILCIIGLHNWLYFFPKRYCPKCGKYQTIHYDLLTGYYSDIKNV